MKRYLIITLIITLIGTVFITVSTAQETSADTGSSLSAADESVAAYLNTLINKEIKLRFENKNNPNICLSNIIRLYDEESENIRAARNAIIVMEETHVLATYILTNRAAIESYMRKKYIIKQIHANDPNFRRAFYNLHKPEQEWLNEIADSIRPFSNPVSRPDPDILPARYVAWLIDREVLMLVTMHGADTVIKKYTELLDTEYGNIRKAMNSLYKMNKKETLDGYLKKNEDIRKQLGTQLAVRRDLIKSDEAITEKIIAASHRGDALLNRCIEFIAPDIPQEQLLDVQPAEEAPAVQQPPSEVTNDYMPPPNSSESGSSSGTTDTQNSATGGQ